MDAQELRRLLELAAKAAGYDVVWNEHWQCFQHRSPRPDKFGNVRHPWVPNDDDGDALRLAAKLKFSIHMFDSHVLVETGFDDGGFREEGDDLNAATRLAIVRAAAAIGEKMEEEK